MGIAKEGEGPVILEVFQSKRLSAVVGELESCHRFGGRQQGALTELGGLGFAAGGKQHSGQ